MGTAEARRLAVALAKYTKSPPCNADGTYTIGNCEPDATCTAAAAMLRAQADELDRLRAELADAIEWRNAAQEELRKCQQDAISLQNELAALREQEPVAWQCRFHISDSWATCSREHHDWVKRAPTEFPDYEARALYAAPVAPAGWQPIKTAPKDGTEIICGDSRHVAPGSWVGRYFAWGYGDNPTHWMPLPTAMKIWSR